MLEKTYGDVRQVMEHPEEPEEKPAGWRGFLSRNFGVLLLRREEDVAYEKRRADYVRVRAMMDDLAGEAYPVRLYPIPENQRGKLVESLNYMRGYSVWSLLSMFLGISLFGWLWEVGPVFGVLRRAGQPGVPPRALAAHLRRRLCADFSAALPAAQAPGPGVHRRRGALRLLGIHDLPGDGDLHRGH